MPTKKRKGKKTKTNVKQSNRQSVNVNIVLGSKAKRSSGAKRKAPVIGDGYGSGGGGGVAPIQRFITQHDAPPVRIQRLALPEPEPRGTPLLLTHNGENQTDFTVRDRLRALEAKASALEPMIQGLPGLYRSGIPEPGFAPSPAPKAKTKPRKTFKVQNKSQFNSMTVSQLEDFLANNEVDPSTIVGTGLNGKVKKLDLVLKALSLIN
jgi:hypothetical protein